MFVEAQMASAAAFNTKSLHSRSMMASCNIDQRPIDHRPLSVEMVGRPLFRPRFHLEKDEDDVVSNFK